jgi:hypothetical protein
MQLPWNKLKNLADLCPPEKKKDSLVSDKLPVLPLGQGRNKARVFSLDMYGQATKKQGANLRN